ncbi:MAG: hypothetical protein FWE10_03700 [Rikenellaceae bacterium]|nr:hypothetical protein [Rikenellaceae bacterium]MCL2692663.1 hypothetical protein [Rikenellaceae bacterium]
MKRILFSLTILAALLFAGACSSERWHGDGEQSRQGTLRLQVNVEGLALDTGNSGATRSAAMTRAMVNAEDGEDLISSLYLMFFEPNDFRQGELIDWVEVALTEDFINMNVQTRIADIDLSGTIIDPDAAYHILAVANINDVRYVGDGMTIDMWMNQWDGLTEDQVMFEARGWVAAGTPIDPNGLLMSGRIVKSAGQTQLNLTLSRTQARLDVVNNTRETYDLVSATAWNGYPSASVWPGGILDYSSSASRIRRYYGVNNSENETSVSGIDGLGYLLGNIRGGLYVFENQVISPERFDNQSTCLIIGLRKRGETETTYYRANIVHDGNSQVLRRNHAYRLTINSVSGPGAPNEELAYIGQGNTIEYTIGTWNLDDNGLIVRDDFSILSIPTKLIQVGRETSTSTFSIYTFTSLSDASPLAVRSQTYTPAGNNIRARLDGNTLVIEADPLGLDETERRGVIVLSFAGLETSMTIIQSGIADDHLRVFLPDGGLPRFLSFAGIPSGLLRVEASGTWTAQLYMDGFSFNAVPNPTNPLKMLASTSGLVADNRFRVYTNTINDTGRTRDAFIVVSLNKDPDNYSAVVRLSQSAAGDINLLPDDQTNVTFDGAGNLVVIPGASNVDTFIVLPGWVDDNSVIKPWTATIIASGSHSDPSLFSVVSNYDATNENNNTVTVSANGVNTFGRQLSAVLRISLTADPSTYTDITLFQQPANVALVPNSVPNVPTVGGQTPAIRVDADASMMWSAVITPDIVWLSDGRTLLHHTATLVDQNGNPLVEGQTYPVSTQFRVRFPKVYYPNRDIPISVKVTVTIGGSMTRILEVAQTPLTSRPVRSFNMRGNDQSWGLISTASGEYNQGWTAALATIPGYTHANGVPSGTTNITTVSVPTDITYLHVVPQQSNTAATNWDWASVHDFINVRDGFVAIVSQSSSLNAVNNPNSPFRRAGYNNLVYGVNSTNVHIAETLSSQTKVYQFLMERGNRPLTASQVSSFHNDGINTIIPGPWPVSAVVMMTKTNNANQAQLIIDPENRFLYLGESQVFWNNSNLTGNRDVFLDNLMFYVGNASRYGSHFTDLFIEDGRPGAQPAPWDDWWGDNRLVPNGVPSK